jgi:hypothetical protein
MSQVQTDRREELRAILERAQMEVGAALANLETYDEEHFAEVEAAAKGLVDFFPQNGRNGGCY